MLSIETNDSLAKPLISAVNPYTKNARENQNSFLDPEIRYDSKVIKKIASESAASRIALNEYSIGLWYVNVPLLGLIASTANGSKATAIGSRKSVFFLGSNEKPISGTFKKHDGSRGAIARVIVSL